VATDDLNVADLDELVELLKATDPAGETIRSVSLDPSEVNVPGIWVSLTGVGPHTLAGVTISLTLYLIVEDAGFARTLGRLADLYNLVRPALPGPPGVATRSGVVLPGSTTPMPALAVPFDMLTTNPEE
jgi:hypothetical protein